MKLNNIARAVALGCMACGSGALFAQTAAAPTPGSSAPSAQKQQKIEVTGSSIRRIADEGALPIEIITAEDIRQRGITSAEELVNQISASAAHVDNATSRNNVFGADQDRLTGGGTFANLRGLGPTGTLVLLDGRRVSTHGMSGGGVDLNAIPIAAVQRVEVLKDGASAIYGTDAIGGVINFILRKDIQRVTINASTTAPTAAGGGTTRRLSISGGLGTLDTTGYSLMGSVTMDQNDILRGIDRPWASGYQPGMGLSPETTSSPHANIIGSANTALGTAGSVVGSTDPTRYTNLNLLAIRNQCDQLPFSVSIAPNIQLWDKFGYTNATSRYRCGTDYGRQFMLAPPKDALNVLVRGAMKFGDHTLTADFVSSKTEVLAEFTPFQFSTTSNALTHYPVNGPHYLDLRALAGAAQFDPTRPIAYRMRMWDWGYRTQLNTSENQRLTVAMTGDLGRFGYKSGLSWGKAKAVTDLIDGYADSNKLVAALASGLINPFLLPGQSQTPAAQALINNTKVTGRVFGGESSVMQADASISGELMKLPAGAVDFATGIDLRKEQYVFSGSQNFNCVSTFATANLTGLSVMGCPGASRSPDRTREISAVYAEALVPVTRALQLQLAVRHDSYQDIGGTTNPKIGFKFQPLPQVAVRGSVNTGFRAPTVQQLYLGSVDLALTGVYSDPERCPVDPTQCQRNSLPYKQGGNPNLKPEVSKQGTLGLLFQPSRNTAFYADYWQVALEDRIRNLTPAFQIANYAAFRENFVRDAAGNVSYIQAGWVNAAQSKTKGLDFGARHALPAFGGRVDLKSDGTYMISHKEQASKVAPLQEFVGMWSTSTLYQRVRLNASVGFVKGSWSTTGSVRWSSGYQDEDRTPYTVNQPVKRDIEAYSTVNLFTTYRGFKNVSLTAGIVNVFDKQPPFTWHNVDNVVGAGWDPRVASPLGRTISLSGSMSF